MFKRYQTKREQLYFMTLRSGVKDLQRSIKKSQKKLKKNPGDKTEQMRYVERDIRLSVYAELLIRFNTIRKENNV